MDPQTCTRDVVAGSYICNPWNKGVVDDAGEFSGSVNEVVFYDVGDVNGSEFSYVFHEGVEGTPVLAGSKAIGEENDFDPVGGDGSWDGVGGVCGGGFEDAVVN